MGNQATCDSQTWRPQKSIKDLATTSGFRQSKTAENSYRSQSPGKAATLKFILDQAVLRDFCRRLKRLLKTPEKECKWAIKMKASGRHDFFSFGLNSCTSFCSQMKFLSWGRIYHSGVWMSAELVSVPGCLFTVLLPNVTFQHQGRASYAFLCCSRESLLLFLTLL